MRPYIGTKLIHAEPAYRCTGGKGEPVIVSDPAEAFPNYPGVEEGYLVVYQDGYKSWSPKETFERAYMAVMENEELPTKAPSIGAKMVDDFIAKIETTTLGEKTTIVRATLRNGFEIVESSSCVSADNYSEEMGREICVGKIRDKVWFLLGFLLQTAVHGIKA